MCKVQSTIIKSAMFFALCTLHISHCFAAPDLAQIKKEIAAAEQQQEQIEKKVNASERDIKSTRSKLVRAGERVSDIESQRADIAQKIAALDSRREKIADELSKNRERIAASAATILFVSRHPSFDSADMRDFVLTSAALSGAAQKFDDEIQIATKQIKELEDIIASRAVEKEKLDRTAKKYATEKKDLDKLLRTRSAQNEKLKTQQSDVQKKLRDLSAAAKNISELSAGVGNSHMSDDSRFSRRLLNPPVRGRLVVKFGEKTALGLQSDGWRIRARGDALVVAPADGVVKFADSFRGFGRVVIMSHKNGYNTVMTNMGNIDVIIGQEMLAGEPVGRMNPDRPEMYMEVRRGSSLVDPSRIFREP